MRIPPIEHLQSLNTADGRVYSTVVFRNLNEMGKIIENAELLLAILAKDESSDTK